MSNTDPTKITGVNSGIYYLWNLVANCIKSDMFFIT
jgi:hypothetical protein